MRDDDIIEIDVKKGTVDLLVDAAELAARPDYVPPVDRDTGGGYLDQYEAARPAPVLRRRAVRAPWARTKPVRTAIKETA